MPITIDSQLFSFIQVFIAQLAAKEKTTSPDDDDDSPYINLDDTETTQPIQVIDVPVFSNFILTQYNDPSAIPEGESESTITLQVETSPVITPTYRIV